MRIRIMLLIFSIIFLFFNCKKAEDVNRSRCIITYLQGNVKIVVNNKENLANVGDFLKEEDSIITDKEAIAEIKVGENAIVKINSNSVVKIAVLLKNNVVENSKINIVNGEIFTKCNKLVSGSSFEVETKSITVGVRGTEFVVANDSINSKVLVVKGNVAVRKNIDVKSIKKLEEIDSSLAASIKENILEEEKLSEGEKIEIEDKKVKDSEQKINESVDLIVEKNKNKYDYENEKEKIHQNIKVITEIRKEKLKDIEFKNIKENLKFKTEFKAQKEEEDKIKIRINFNTDSKTAILVSYNDVYYGTFYQNMELNIDKKEKVRLKFASNDYEVEELEIDGSKINKKEEVFNINLKREDKKKKIEKIKKELNEEKEKIKEKIKKDNKIKEKINEKIEEKIKEVEKTIDELDKELENNDKSLLDDLEEMDKEVKNKGKK